MNVSRRYLIGASTSGAIGTLVPTDAVRATQPASIFGRDATQFGVRPGSADDQTRALQRAIDEAARAQVSLVLPPGMYATSMLRVHSGTQLVGVRGATRLFFKGGASMFAAEGANNVGFTGIALDGGGIPLAPRRGLVHCVGGRDIRIADCEITGSGGSGIWLENVSGEVSGNIVTQSATTAIVSFDAQGLAVTRNSIQGTNDNGIEILRTTIGYDAHWSRTTALRTSRPAPAAPASMATPSTRFVPATSSCGEIVSAIAIIRPCGAIRRPTSRSSATASQMFARSRFIRNSRSKAP